jgi:hypothetical protein
VVEFIMSLGELDKVAKDVMENIAKVYLLLT